MSGQNVNLQESFLNHIRKEGIQVEVTLLNGSVILGQVRGFDNFTVILHVDGMQHLVFKHAIVEMIAPKFASRPRPDAEEAPETDGNHARPRPPRQHHPRRREAPAQASDKADDGPDPAADAPDQGDQGEPRPAKEPRREKREAVKPEKFNPIDLSGIKLELAKPHEKPSE